LELGKKNKDQANIVSQTPLFDNSDDEEMNKPLNSIKEMEDSNKGETTSQNQNDINM
jgi:hypothetical protein